MIPKENTIYVSENLCACFVKGEVYGLKIDGKYDIEKAIRACKNTLLSIGKFGKNVEKINSKDKNYWKIIDYIKKFEKKFQIIHVTTEEINLMEKKYRNRLI